MGRAAGGIDQAVLEELRAIRSEIHDLNERVSQSATREDLDDYVTREAFENHVKGHERIIEGWRGWVPIGIACFAVFWNIVGPYIHIGAR